MPSEIEVVVVESAADISVAVSPAEISTALVVNVGPQGIQGLQGDRGLQGIPGERGLQGVPGQNGAPGSNGLSAYQIALAAGFVGTEAQWLDSLVGADGADSTVPGPQGAPGQDGAPGADGLSAYQIAVANGFSGDETQWLASLTGAPGAPGADGQDGSDASVTSQNIASALGFAPIGDAPSDGSQYARKDGAWEVVSGGGGSFDQDLNTTDSPTFASLSVSATETIDISNGLLAYWKLDTDAGSVSLTDSAANGYDLTNNGATVGTGIIAEGANGNGGWLNTSTPFDFSGDFSFSLWSNNASQGDIPFCGEAGVGLNLNVASGVFGVGVPGVRWVVQIFTSPAIDDNFHHYTVTRSSGVISVYLDGELAASATDNTDFSSTYGFFADPNGTFLGNGVCDVDEVGVWSRAISPGEVTALYNAGDGLAFDDFSSVSSTVVITKSALNANGSASFAGGAASIDSDGNITAANLPATFFSGASQLFQGFTVTAYDTAEPTFTDGVLTLFTLKSGPTGGTVTNTVEYNYSAGQLTSKVLKDASGTTLNTITFSYSGTTLTSKVLT